MPTSANPLIRAVQQCVTAADGCLTLVGVAPSTVTGTTQQNQQYTGILLGINITSISAGTLTVTLEGQDPITGTKFTLLASAGLAVTGYTTMSVCPGLPATANVSANAILPGTYDIKAVVAVGTVSATISQTLIP